MVMHNNTHGRKDTSWLYDILKLEFYYRSSEKLISCN